MTDEVLNTEIEIPIYGTTQKWYTNLGYKLPVEKRQRYSINEHGVKIKAGFYYAVPDGTKLTVKVKDLPVTSNVKIPITCPECKKTYSITRASYTNKKSDICNKCTNYAIKLEEGIHQTWVNRLIKRNPDAKCDISGETDKRFLELHHLLSRANGGKNEENNYVILSANYHRAFHIDFLGATMIKSTPERYNEFKQQELTKLKALQNDTIS